MAITFSPISPERSEDVIRFLSEVFDIKKLPANLYPETQNWKYFAPHPWWPTPRSFVLESGNQIAAHGCVAPIRFAVAGSILDRMVIIDWASGKLVPGAGLLIYRRCMELQKTSLLAIGGSNDTVRILPEVPWFKPQANMKWYARSLKKVLSVGRSSLPASRRRWNPFWMCSPKLGLRTFDGSISKSRQNAPCRWLRLVKIFCCHAPATRPRPSTAIPNA